MERKKRSPNTYILDQYTMMNQNNSNNNSSTSSSSSTSTAAADTPLPTTIVAPPKSYFKSPQDQELIRLALHKSPFFTCLDEEQVDRLVRHAHRETFAPGSIVILEGCIDDDGIEEDEDELDDDENDKFSESSNISRLRGDDAVTAIADVDEADDDENNNDHNDNIDLVDETVRSNEQKDNGKINVETAAGESVNDSSSKSEPSSSSVQEESTNDAPTLKQSSENVIADTTTTTTIVADNYVHNIDASSSSVDPPHPPRSGKVRSLYIVKKGKADVWYNQSQINPASLGPGTLFGEGGFLFGRQHSASIVASSSSSSSPASNNNDSSNGVSSSSNVDALECFVVDLPTFRNHVLPSQNMTQLFEQHAQQIDERGVRYMSLQDFEQACQYSDNSTTNTLTPVVGTFAAPAMLQIADAYNTLGSSSSSSSSFRRGRRRRSAPFALPTESTTTTTDASNSSSSNRRIYLDHFCLFHLLMSRPDPEVDLAFLLMDQRKTGQIFLDDLKKFVDPVLPGINYQADFFQRYFGPINGDEQCIRGTTNFSQFLLDLQKEMGKQTFLQAVQNANKTGQEQQNGSSSYSSRFLSSSYSNSSRATHHSPYLEPTDFVNVIKKTCGWRLPSGVVDRLESLYCHNSKSGIIQTTEDAPATAGESTTEITEHTHNVVSVEEEGQGNVAGDRYFAYPDFLAFQEVLANLPGICNLIDQAQEIKKGPVSPDDFKVANRVMGLGGTLSRRQVDVVFLLFDLDRDGFVSHEDTVKVCGVDFSKRLVAVEGRQGRSTFAPPPEFRLKESAHDSKKSDDNTITGHGIEQWLLNLSLGAIAGSLGIVALYPLDLIKTRLMNQRLGVNGHRMYANSLQCLRLAIHTEGIRGLYRGLAPQLLCIAPEKAIKLHVNDLLRQVWTIRDAETGKPKINLKLEVLAGACAGACQLLVTNPMELIKIRLQMQGETARLLRSKGLAPPAPLSFIGVLRDLGFPGVYRGASACLLRDIPFSAIYFPSYAWFKEVLAERHEIAGQVTPSDLLLAGTAASLPAALLTTPADVVKTRLQTLVRPGEVSYAGMRDCANKIYQQEGIIGFFQGIGARVLRIAPQFGFSLLAYEYLASQMSGLLHHNVVPGPPTNAFVDPYDYRTAFPPDARCIQSTTGDTQHFMNNRYRQQPVQHHIHANGEMPPKPDSFGS